MLLGIIFIIFILIVIFLFVFSEHDKELFLFKNKEIPKILYKTGPLKFEELSDDVIKIFEDTMIKNRDLKIEYFDDSKCKKFIKENFETKVYEAYENLVPGAYKADLFRYCILYIYGGIYSDLTQVFQIPFERIINFKKDRLVLVDDIKLRNHSKNGIQINFMAARPRLNIFKEAIYKIVDNVKNNFYGKSPLEPTGPMLFREIYDLECKKSIRNKARIELTQVQKYDGNHRVVFKNNRDDIAYYNKAPNHNLHILKTKENSYAHKWKMKQIYRNYL